MFCARQRFWSTVVVLAAFSDVHGADPTDARLADEVVPVPTIIPFNPGALDPATRDAYLVFLLQRYGKDVGEVMKGPAHPQLHLTAPDGEVQSPQPSHHPGYSDYGQAAMPQTFYPGMLAPELQTAFFVQLLQREGGSIAGRVTVNVPITMSAAAVNAYQGLSKRAQQPKTL